MPNLGLFPEAAGLLQGAAQSAEESLRTNQADSANTANVAERSAATATGLQEQQMGQQADLQRQREAGSQKIQEALVQARSEAELKQQEYLQNTVEVPPEFAQGMVKTTGNPSYAKLAGQRVPWKEMFAGFSAEVKGKYTKPISTQIMENGKPVNMILTPIEDQNGNVTWSPQRVGEGVPRGTGGRAASGGAGGKQPTYEGYSKDADKILQNINVTLGKKGNNLQTNMRDKILSLVGASDSQKQAKIAALKQQYSDYQTAVQNANQLAEKEGRAPKVIDTNIKKSMDTLLSLDTGAATSTTGAASPDQAVIDFLKDPEKNGTGKVIKDTPANRAWAKEQIGG